MPPDEHILCRMIARVKEAAETVWSILHRARSSDLRLQRLDEALLVLPHAAAQATSFQQFPLARLTEAELAPPWHSPLAEGILEVKAAGERGLGVFTLSQVMPQQCLLKETPLIVAPVASSGDPDGFGKERQDYDAAVQSLLPEDQAEFWSFQDSAAEESTRSAEGVFITNAIPCGPQASLAGMYRVLSRVNHSCTPNAYRFWSDDLGKEVLVASKVIPARGEVYISYIPIPRWPRAMRLDHLRKNFAFDCSCPLCTLPDVQLLQDDDRRRLLGRIEEAVAGALPKQKRMALSLAAQRFELLSQSESRLCLAHAALDAHKIAVVSRSFDVASTWASLHARLVCIAQGPESAEAKGAAAQCYDSVQVSPDELCISFVKQPAKLGAGKPTPL